MRKGTYNINNLVDFSGGGWTSHQDKRATRTGNYRPRRGLGLDVQHSPRAGPTRLTDDSRVGDQIRQYPEGSLELRAVRCETLSGASNNKTRDLARADVFNYSVLNRTAVTAILADALECRSVRLGFVHQTGSSPAYSRFYRSIGTTRVRAGPSLRRQRSYGGKILWHAVRRVS